MGGTTVIKREKGIPGNNAKKRIVDMGGPVPQQRSRLTSEQLAEVQNRPLQRKGTQEGPSIIPLASSAPTTVAEREDYPRVNAIEDEDEEVEDEEGEEEYIEDEEVEQEEIHEEEVRTPMRTRNVPQSEAPVYSRQQATYVAPRRQTQQYPSSTPAATSSTREMNGRTRQTTNPRLVRAGDLRTRTNFQQSVAARPAPLKKTEHRHPLFWIGMTLVGLLFAYIVIAFFVWPAAVERYNDIRYRDPRIDYSYAVLGTNDSVQHPSFITTINKSGQIIVTLYPGKALAPIAYVLQPVAVAGADHIPATIEIIPGKTSTTKYIAIHYNGSTLILSYESNTLKRIM